MYHSRSGTAVQGVAVVKATREDQTDRTLFCREGTHESCANNFIEIRTNIANLSFLFPTQRVGSWLPM